MKEYKKYVADFETLADTSLNYTRVWLWGFVNEKNEFCYGNSLDSFFEKIDYLKENSEIYFHNLKFDGSFILNYLLRNNFILTEKPQKSKKSGVNRSYSCFINDMGNYYSISFYNLCEKMIVIKNSLNLLPFSVASMGNGVIEKGEIDYTLYREVGYKPTEKEVEYVKNDCILVMNTLKGVWWDKGFNRMTVGGNALSLFKDNTINYDKYFPKLSTEVDGIIRQSYRGGLCLTTKEYGKTYEGYGQVYDINSMYPACLYYYKMPIGYPRKFSGSPENLIKKNILFVVKIKVRFTVKEGGIPFLQIKNNLLFATNEYIKDSHTYVDVTLTSVDFYHFCKNYDYHIVEWMGGYRFDNRVGIFKDYIDYYINEKIEGKKANDKNRSYLAKLMLNALTGKFATSPIANKKIPYLKDGILKFTIENDTKETEYVPLTCFITAYSRHILLSSIYSNKEEFYYCDTDSLHFISQKPNWIPKGLNIHNEQLGAWKKEYTFTKARYIKQKTYIERKEEGENEVRCAGLNTKYHHLLNFNNFKKGGKIENVLKPKQVEGGVILYPLTYEIT